MEREKMIEEILYKFCERHGIEDKCYDSGKKCADMSCAIRLIATKIVNKYIPEGSVVLTKEEYEELKNLDVSYDALEDQYLNLKKKAGEIRKETAKEILSEVFSPCNLIGGGIYDLTPKDKERLYKKYGVEVDE